MCKTIDMTGQRIGNLTVIDRADRTDTKKRAFWVCRCDCGNVISVRGDRLRSGETHYCSECKYAGGRPSVFIEKRTFTIRQNRR